jgi:hypothetical protein
MENFKKLIYKGVEYLVSDHGFIYKDGKKLNHRKNKDGYIVVYTKDAIRNKDLTTGVHRLVGFTFIENDDVENKVEINHKDYDRENNHVDNLEWISRADNVRYSVCNKPDMRGEKNNNFGNRKLSKFYKDNPDVALEKQSRKGSRNGRCVKISLYKDNEFVKTFEYIGECCEYLKDKYSIESSIDSMRNSISKCIKNNREYKGFTFKKHQ